MLFALHDTKKQNYQLQDTKVWEDENKIIEKSLTAKVNGVRNRFADRIESPHGII